MNKTLTVNIGGLVFHIDENAYHKLDHYLQAIRRSFLQEEQDEIIHDIEIRIAELFNEKITDTNQVITESNVEEVINIMGKPEDYILDDEETIKTEYIYTGQKKLYRDTDKGVIGGVLAGLGHYFKTDVVWIRILFAFLLVFYGTGVLLYLILWIIIPAAKTTSQRLEMEREPINIETIEKKVKENVSYVTNKINDIDYDNIKRQTQVAGEKSGKWIRYIFGIGFIAFSAINLLTSIVAAIGVWVNKDFILAETAAEGVPFFLFSEANYGRTIALVFMLVTLPFIGLLIIGLRLIYTNIKYVAATIISLIIIWFITLGLFAIPFANAKNWENLGNQMDRQRVERQTNFTFYDTDSLHIKFVDAAYFDSNRSTTDGFEVTDTANTLPIEIELLPSFQDEIYGKVSGTNFAEARYTKKGRQSELIYTNEVQAIQFDQKDNVLLIASSINNDKTTEAKLKYSIYIPQGKSVYINGVAKTALIDQQQIGEANHWYKMQEDNTLQCLDCAL